MSVRAKENLNGVRLLRTKEEFDGHKYQKMVWKCTARFIDILAGRRGGKDFVGVRKAVKNIIADAENDKFDPQGSYEKRLPGLHYWFIAPTYSLTKVIIKHLLKAIPTWWILDNKLNSSMPHVWLKPNILIEFKSANNPEMLVGEGIHGVYVTETARLKPSVWNDNVRPTLSEHMGWGIFTTTPVGHNWYIDQIRNIANSDDYDDWAAFYWTTLDNDQMPGLKEEIELAKKTMPKKYFDRNYLASPDAFFGQIYDEFRGDIHIQNFDYDPKRYFCVVGGIDWGYTHHAGFVIVGITHDGHVDVLEEYSVSGKQTENWMEVAKKKQVEYGELFQMFYAGPDQPEHIQMFKQNGIRITEANNNVSAGIQTVATLMTVDENGNSRYRSHVRCKRLNKYKPAYTWIIDKSNDESTERPEKKDDDEQDMERYAIHSAKKSGLFDLAVLEKLGE